MTNLKVEVEYVLKDSLLNQIEKLIVYSNVPKINTSSFFIKCFNDFLLDGWKPLFIKCINTSSNIVVGIIPLMFKTFKRKEIIPYKKLRFFGSTFSDFHDVYAKPEHKEVTIKTSMNWLYNGPFKWQEMIIDDILSDTNIIKPLERYLAIKKANYRLTIGSYFYINLQRSWEAIINDTSKSFVWKNVKLAKNRITKAGNWEIEYNPNIDEDEIIKRFRPIHIERQKALGRKSRFSDEGGDLQAFKKILTYHLENNQFNTYWLKFNNVYIGYMLGFYIDNIFYWWSTAFKEDYKNFYPSRLLQYYVLEFMHKNNYREFNFMRGESGYKNKWTKTCRSNYRFRIYNNKDLYGKLLGVFDKNFR
ncbi:GNAT family N-acetyltransferase [Flavivirga sp. 57AJ16]|uniref:GNAT family N-acetyltransferase n=1 Tax=Flavivirga sp. 57AJ16 TaxID=3025307 RepID=UPI00236609CF|nr:GNAT family N-acetyltransferase [Flavivirga sp. 57AJ16]MDD7886234.1 GNAT family N-acetyltransferase [Flavivirga sp. 57AJ16]